MDPRVKRNNRTTWLISSYTHSLWAKCVEEPDAEVIAWFLNQCLQKHPIRQWWEPVHVIPDQIIANKVSYGKVTNWSPRSEQPLLQKYLTHVYVSEKQTSVPEIRRLYKKLKQRDSTLQLLKTFGVLATNTLGVNDG